MAAETTRPSFANLTRYYRAVARTFFSLFRIRGYVMTRITRRTNGYHKSFAPRNGRAISERSENELFTRHGVYADDLLVCGRRGNDLVSLDDRARSIYVSYYFAGALI